MSVPACSGSAGFPGQCWSSEPDRRLSRSAAPAAQGDRPADQEADYGGPHRELRPVLADLTADVGHLHPAVAQRVDRARELMTLLDDVVPDLLGRAATGRRRRPASVASGWKGPARRGAHDMSSCPFCPSKAALISLASSIAMSGVG